MMPAKIVISPSTIKSLEEVVLLGVALIDVLRKIHCQPESPHLPSSVSRPADIRLDVAAANICPKKKRVVRKLVSPILYHVER